MGGKALHFRGKRLSLGVSGGAAAGDVAIFCLYLYGSSSSSEQDLLLRQGHDRDTYCCNKKQEAGFLI